MAFSKITKDMNIIAALPDEPNDIGGLTAAELKAKFDEGGLAIKTAVNGLVDEIEAGTSAASIGAKDKDSADSTVQDEIGKSHTHIANTSNPHSVTKAQVGLGNVDNTSDIAKPVSTATQTALDAKQTKITASGILKGDGSGGVTAAVKGTDYDNEIVYAVKNVTTAYNIYQMLTAGKTVLYKEAAEVYYCQSAEISGGDYKAFFVQFVAAYSGLPSTLQCYKALHFIVSNSDWGTPTYIGVEPSGHAASHAANGNDAITPSDIGAASATSLTSHTGNTSNPHRVTKAQVGLGNVDNTADLNKPISTSTQTALDGKQSKVTARGVLKGDGTGGVTAAVAGTDYDAPFKVIATGTFTDPIVVTANKTYAEIKTAYLAGLKCVLVLSMSASLQYCMDIVMYADGLEQIVFSDGLAQIIFSEDGTITYSEMPYEYSSNKVTSLSSSSTDTQYPSAKCVYDIVGNIESALAALR